MVAKHQLLPHHSGLKVNSLSDIRTPVQQCEAAPPTNTHIVNGLILQHLHRSQVQDIIKDEGGRVGYHHDDEFLGIGFCFTGISLCVREEKLLQNVNG